MNDHNRLVEGEGVHAVGLMASKLGILFRQINAHDKGIDAELELTQPRSRNVGGCFIGLQIKSRSKFRLTADKYISITVKDQTLKYWKNYGRPVLLMAYSRDDIFWVRVDNASSRTIKISLEQKFNELSLPLLQQIVSQYYTDMALIVPTENVSDILADLGQTVGIILEENASAIKEANDFLVARAFNEAVKIYEAFSVIYRQSPKIMHNLGVSLLGARRFEEALKISNRLIEKAPSNVLAYHLSAGCLISLQRYDEAERRLLQALKFAPNSARILDLLGLLLYWQNRNEEALRYFFQIFENHLETAEICFNTALCLTALGLYPQALLLYDVCLLLNPDIYDTYNNKALLLQHLFRFQEALEFYEKAIHLEPQNLMALCNCAYLLKDLGRNAEAIQRYNEALLISPNNESVHFNLGALFCRVNQWETAAYHLNEGYGYLQIQENRQNFKDCPKSAGIIDIGFDVLYIIELEIREDSIRITSVDDGSEYALLKDPVIKAYSEQAYLINKPLKDEVIREAFNPHLEKGIIPDTVWVLEEIVSDEQQKKV
jgi:tetratricopeptide (TPR) repeat protein